MQSRQSQPSDECNENMHRAYALSSQRKRGRKSAAVPKEEGSTGSPAKPTDDYPTVKEALAALHQKQEELAEAATLRRFLGLKQDLLESLVSASFNTLPGYLPAAEADDAPNVIAACRRGDAAAATALCKTSHLQEMARLSASVRLTRSPGAAPMAVGMEVSYCPMDFTALPDSLDLYDKGLRMRTADMSMGDHMHMFKGFIGSIADKESNVRVHGEFSPYSGMVIKAVQSYMIWTNFRNQTGHNHDLMMHTNNISGQEEEPPEGWFRRCVEALPFDLELAKVLRMAVTYQERQQASLYDNSDQLLSGLPDLLRPVATIPSLKEQEERIIMDELLNNYERHSKRDRGSRNLLAAFMSMRVLQALGPTACALLFLGCWPYYPSALVLAAEYVMRKDVQAALATAEVPMLPWVPEALNWESISFPCPAKNASSPVGGALSSGGDGAEGASSAGYAVGGPSSVGVLSSSGEAVGGVSINVAPLARLPCGGQTALGPLRVAEAVVGEGPPLLAATEAVMVEVRKGGMPAVARPAKASIRREEGAPRGCVLASARAAKASNKEQSAPNAETACRVGGRTSSPEVSQVQSIALPKAGLGPLVRAMVSVAAGGQNGQPQPGAARLVARDVAAVAAGSHKLVQDAGTKAAGSQSPEGPDMPCTTSGSGGMGQVGSLGSKETCDTQDAWFGQQNRTQQLQQQQQLQGQEQEQQWRQQLEQHKQQQLGPISFMQQLGKDQFQKQQEQQQRGPSNLMQQLQQEQKLQQLGPRSLLLQLRQDQVQHQEQRLQNQQLKEQQLEPMNLMQQMQQAYVQHQEGQQAGRHALWLASSHGQGGSLLQRQQLQQQYLAQDAYVPHQQRQKQDQTQQQRHMQHKQPAQQLQQLQQLQQASIQQQQQQEGRHALMLSPVQGGQGGCQQQGQLQEQRRHAYVPELHLACHVQATGASSALALGQEWWEAQATGRPTSSAHQSFSAGKAVLGLRFGEGEGRGGRAALPIWTARVDGCLEVPGLGALGVAPALLSVPDDAFGAQHGRHSSMIGAQQRRFSATFGAQQRRVSATCWLPQRQGLAAMGAQTDAELLSFVDALPDVGTDFGADLAMDLLNEDWVL